MKLTTITSAFGLLALAAGLTGAQAAKPSYKRDLPDSLAREAKISESAAIAVAKHAVPEGRRCQHRARV
jgi:hypothetical protein